MSALLMAGLDGIKNRTLPSEQTNFGPYDDNIFDWSEDKQAELTSIPASLEEALEALDDDHDFLLEGGVFSTELIKSWAKEKMKEVVAVRNRPHPFEMNLYYNL
jgi:glutamine synthetase